jgi:diguanylate cyclase (GGDEF)-like protein/PAS domain S-box-containing protein
MTRTTIIGRHKLALPLLVFMAGAVLSIALGATAHQEIRRAARERFDAVATELARKVEGRFDDYVAVLAGVRARFNTGAPITQGDFRDYVAGLNLAHSYPGFQAMNYAPLVKAHEKQAFEEAMRGESGLARFAVKPPGERAEYYPLAFIEPLAGNEALLGNDLGAMPNRGTALEQARDSAGLASSGRRIRIAGRDADVGLAMRLPVYRPRMPLDTVEQRRNAYIGSVGAGFSVGQMMQGLIASGQGSTLRLRLIDAGTSASPIGTRVEARFVAAGAAAEHQLLYDSVPARPTAGAAPADARAPARFERTLAFDLGGHSWLVEVGQDELEIVGRLDGIVSWLIALGGVAISALLAAIVHSLATSRSRAQVLAAGMTRHLRRSERQLEDAQHLANVGSWTLDPVSGVLHPSGEARRLLGFDAGKTADLPQLLARVPDEERAHVAELIRSACASRERSEFEHRVRLPGGVERWLHVTVQLCAEDGRLLVRGAIRDDTQRRKAALRLALEHEVTRLLLDDGEAATVVAKVLQAICTSLRWDCAALWRVHADGRARCTAAWHADPDPALEQFIAISRTLDYGCDEGSLGRAWSEEQPVRIDGLADRHDFTRDALAGQAGLAIGLVVPMAASGARTALEFFSRDPYAADADAIDSLRVISLQLAQFEQRKSAEHDLRHLASHDDLTGLLNRAALQHELARCIARSKRHQRRFAVLFIDLDRFKHINDTLGHGVGDAMIQTCGQRLKAMLRSDDVVARFGGDEFVIVLENLSGVNDASLVAQKALTCCTEPFVIEGQELHVGASIGVAIYPEDGTDGETLLKHADVAMYRAKDIGRGTYRFYDPHMNARGTERLMLESALRHAMERNELEMHYQPKMDLRSRRIVGVEALMRWRHPVLGMVPPAQFIPIAEETGLIQAMGRWAMERACADAHSWQERGLPAVQMAVNLSPRQLDSLTLVDDVASILASSGLHPSLLELEITESAMMKNTGHAVTLLKKLRAMGIGLAMDDFGTGYSSLSYLRRFPLSTVKIDRSFINDLPHDADAQALIEGIIKLAHSLRMNVVAEGVESAAQLDYLAAHGCDQIQGYWLCRPVPATEAGQFILRHARDRLGLTMAA